MSNASRRKLIVVVFAAAFVGCFLFYGISNDHYDRLTRARQIAIYGDVPFRDFFDPGYFLTLYASALCIRLFGERLLGEALLNLTCLATGITIVFAIATRLTQSVRWGGFAALLVVCCEPRAYDYDKILFYPLGLAVCWNYADRPTIGSLAALSGVAAVAGLFRYDSAVYIGAAAVLTIIARHWRDWAAAAGRLGAAGVLAVLFASPALLFIHATAGLGPAVQQMTTYARVEGERTRAFELARFRFDWHAGLVGSPSTEGGVGLAERLAWLPGIVTKDNAAAWIYWSAAGLAIAMLLLPISPRNRHRTAVAKALSLSALLALVTAFVLRDPIAARVADVMPLVAIGFSRLAGEWRPSDSTPDGGDVGWSRRIATPLGLTLMTLTGVAIAALLWIPPVRMFDLVERARILAQAPPPMSQLPKGDVEPIVTYLNSCTTDSDRAIVAWFAPEIFFFSRRGFAAGLPVVFGGHWNAMPYQRRSLELLERQSVPVIVTRDAPPLGGYEFLADFVQTHYHLAFDGRLAVSPRVAIWVRNDRQPVRTYPGSTLPCFAG